MGFGVGACADGSYGDNGYSYAWGRRTAYQYIDSGDNENWVVTSISNYFPAYKM